jgi:hypothetical protein
MLSIVPLVSKLMSTDRFTRFVFVFRVRFFCMGFYQLKRSSSPSEDET